MSYDLYHHGILGMKWGVRRFQNKDGTLTPKGKSHDKAARASSMSDDELTSKVKRMSLENTYNKMSKERERPSKIEKTKKLVDATSRLTDEARKIIETKPQRIKMDLAHMTDQQMRERINRVLLENQYNSMFAPEAQVSKGKEYASKALSIGGAVLATTSSALGIALAIKELKKG